MAWEPTLYSVLGFGAAGISAVVAIQVWRHREERGAVPFVALMVALCGWSLASAIQLGFATGGEQLLWQRVSLVIGGTIPTLWLFFAAIYAGRDRWLTRPVAAVFLLEPLAFALLTLTNPAHGMVWGGAELTPTAAGPVLSLSLAIGYYVHITYAYLLILAGLALLGLVFVRNPSVYRTQTALLILGTLPPFLGNVMFTLRMSWGPLPGLDPTPFAFAVTGVLFGFALFRFDLLQRAPIARERALEEMGDGLLVLDTDGYVVDVNPTARELLSPTPAVGDSLSDLGFGDGPTVESTLSAIDGRTLSATVDGRDRAYDVDCSELTTHAGDPVGHSVAFRDVTDRNRYEQRLEVTQRVLRHNLRNDVAVIQGHADQLARNAADEQARSAELILERTERLVDVSEKTRKLIHLQGMAESSKRPVDVRAALLELVEEFREEHPRATIECEPADVLEAELSDVELFETPVRNVVENAIEHNTDDEPWVRVIAETDGEFVTVRTVDSCPPIPAMERQVLEEGTESSLQHGSGLGLWLTYLSVRTAGGRADFDTREPRGNVVTLEFPATPV